MQAAQRKDVRIIECITDAKGDRSRPPGKQDDPDAYTRVVERRSDGVVIRGAKLHITGASMAHDLMVIPTKAMKPGEEAYAIGCAVPVNSPGVKIIDTTFAPRHPDMRTFPVSAKIHMPEGFVILDNVFVPNERIFLDGAVAAGRRLRAFARALGAAGRPVRHGGRGRPTGRLRATDRGGQRPGAAKGTSRRRSPRCSSMPR